MTESVSHPSTADRDQNELRRPHPDADADGGDDQEETRSSQDKTTQNRDGRHEDAGKASADDKAASPDEKKDKPVEAMPLPSKWPFIIAGVLLLGFLGWSGYTHWQRHQAALQTRDDTVNAVLELQTIEVKSQNQPIPLVLPGQTEPFDTANIYPRATGYVTARKVDIGSRVRKGDLLIHIAAPDLDQQLAQAQAQIGQVQASALQAQSQVEQAEANLNLAEATFGRASQLTQQGYETVQNRDNQQANLTSQKANVATARAGVQVAEANVKAQQATVDRLQALATFEDVTAPFEGVVTARNTDVGNLLNADTSTGPPLFTIVSDEILRVSVSIPQNAAVGVHDGVEADIMVPQMPGRIFKGKVTRSSVALNASSRSLMVEVDVGNQDGILRSGLYVSVKFAIPRSHPTIEVPAEALIFNQHGMQVATVDDGSLIQMKPIAIERDLGATVEIREGLEDRTLVVLNPPANLQQGQKVKAVPRQNEDDGAKPSTPPAQDKEAKADSKSHQD